MPKILSTHTLFSVHTKRLLPLNFTPNFLLCPWSFSNLILFGPSVDIWHSETRLLFKHIFHLNFNTLHCLLLILPCWLTHHWERQNSSPPKDICVPIPRVCECLFYMYKREMERERLYKYNEKPWNGYNPALARLAQYNHKHSYKRRKQDCQIREGEIMAETSHSNGLTSFQNGREDHEPNNASHL